MESWSPSEFVFLHSMGTRQGRTDTPAKRGRSARKYQIVVVSGGEQGACDSRQSKQEHVASAQTSARSLLLLAWTRLTCASDMLRFRCTPSNEDVSVGSSGGRGVGDLFSGGAEGAAAVAEALPYQIMPETARDMPTSFFVESSSPRKSQLPSSTKTVLE